MMELNQESGDWECLPQPWILFLYPVSTLSHHAFLKTNEIILSTRCNLIPLQLNEGAMHCEQTLSSAEFRNCPWQCFLCLFTVLWDRVEAWAFAFLIGVLLSWPRNTWRGVSLAWSPDRIPFMPATHCRRKSPAAGPALIKSSAWLRKTWLFVQHHGTLCDTPQPGLEAVTVAFHNSKSKAK